MQLDFLELFPQHLPLLLVFIHLYLYVRFIVAPVSHESLFNLADAPIQVFELRLESKDLILKGVLLKSSQFAADIVGSLLKTDLFSYFSHIIIISTRSE